MVQQEDGGPWTYDTVVGRGDHNHSNRSCIIRITMIGHKVTRNSKYIKAIPITAKQYLRDKLTKNMVDPVDELL